MKVAPLRHEFLTFGGLVGLAIGAAEELRLVPSGRLPVPDADCLGRIEGCLRGLLVRLQSAADEPWDGVEEAAVVYDRGVAEWQSGVDDLAEVFDRVAGRTLVADLQGVGDVVAVLRRVRDRTPTLREVLRRGR